MTSLLQHGGRRGKPGFKGRDAPTGQAVATLVAIPELEAVIAERLFYTTFVVAGLSDIHASQAAIIELLRDDLGLD